VCPSFVFAVDHAGYGAVGHLSTQVGCPDGIAVAEFAAQRGRADGEWRRLHCSSLGENKAKVILGKLPTRPNRLRKTLVVDSLVPAPDFSPGERAFKPAETLRI